MLKCVNEQEEEEDFQEKEDYVAEMFDKIEGE